MGRKSKIKRERHEAPKEGSSYGPPIDQSKLMRYRRLNDVVLMSSALLDGSIRVDHTFQDMPYIDNSGSYLPVLWMTAGLNSIQTFLGIKPSMYTPLFPAGIVLGTEVMQQYGLLGGTYDTKDFIAGVLGGLTAIGVTKGIDYIVNRLTK
ncbi:hypothetical protein HZB01_01335 [Candidatus Woesearchaeota archaeon]|nr:hypothetical protein [Candidatus Woesearchaeota archaeon]